MKPWSHTQNTLEINILWLSFIQVVYNWLKNSNLFALSFQESGKNEMKSYMRHYVPYKPGDEFKYRTPEGKPIQIYSRAIHSEKIESFIA